MGLTKTVAREFAGRNILCNAVAPGFVASDMTASLDPKYEAQIFKTIPLGARCPLLHLAGQARATGLMHQPLTPSPTPRTFARPGPYGQVEGWRALKSVWGLAWCPDPNP